MTIRVRIGETWHQWLGTARELFPREGMALPLSRQHPHIASPFAGIFDRKLVPTYLGPIPVNIDEAVIDEKNLP